MAKYDFRILIETKKGRQFSYCSSSFFNTAVDTSFTASALSVWNRISKSISCSYHNFQTSSDAITKSTGIFAADNFLSSSLQGSNESGIIRFIYRGPYGNPGYRDQLKRFKFFGQKVCQTLDLREDHWYRPNKFILGDAKDKNYFSGDADVRNLNVTNLFEVSSVGSVNSDIPIKINKDTSRYIKFTNISGSNELPHDDLTIGYNDITNTYMISASHRSGDSHKFVIDGVTSMNVTHFTSSYQTSSVEQIFTQITSSGNSLFGDDPDTDTHVFKGNVVIAGKGHTEISHSVDGLAVSGDISASGVVKGTSLETINGDVTINNGNLELSTLTNINFGYNGRIIQTQEGIRINNHNWAPTGVAHLFVSHSGAFDSGAQTALVGIGTETPSKALQVEGDISASKNLFVGASSTDDVVASFSHNESGSLMEVKATADSGSLVLSGSLLIKDNNLLPEVSASKLYNSGSNLYWSGDSHIPNYSIAPKVRQYFHHNFWDTVTTSTVYIPWYDQSELSSGGYGTGGNLFVCNARLLKVFARFYIIDGDADVTIRLHHRLADSNTQVNQISKTVAITDGEEYEVHLFDFTNESNTVVPAGSIGSISITAESGFTTANRAMNLTSVWELDHSTELTASIT